MNEKATPATYRLQSGCHDCRHCLTHEPTNEPVYYFCTYNQPAPPTPPPKYSEHFEWQIPSAGYRHWRRALPEVSAAGICDHYERLPEVKDESA